jgi:hypothetical protein
LSRRHRWSETADVVLLGISVQIPSYWAEARLQRKTRARSVTVRRFGWSDISQEDAQAMADARCAEALKQILAGRELSRREQRVPYNGADGLPIREEILARHGEAVVTRNSYGAHCLNVPDALFADVDFEDYRPGRHLYLAVFLVLATASGALWLHMPHKPCDPSWLLPLIFFCAVSFIPITQFLYRASLRLCGGVERVAVHRIERFARRHPTWRVRLYFTPSGLRTLTLHRRFQPNDPEVEAYFSALRVDPVYAAMCRHQQCFRARLTGKPWRMGIESHMKPRPGVWPVSPERLADRQSWTRDYDKRAEGFSACRFVREIGVGNPAVELDAIQELHDALSGALSTRPVA